MMFVWHGHGYLVLVFYVAALILTQLVVDHVQGDGFYTATAWPKYLGIGVGALLCWVVGRWLNSGAGRRLVDPETGEEVILPAPSHDFIFIKVEYWGLIGSIACVVLTALSEFGIVQL
jgi:hypothetical protein